MKKLAALPILMASGLTAQTVEKPNIILIYIDDMGYSDLTCYGGDYAPTPNIDQLAGEGIRFTQYYTACPISSPSRVGVTSGMFPTRWGITTFLNDRASNARNQSNDYLLDHAPSMARTLKSNGYATGHFGKWHMGGGRDVTNAPSILNYGFDEYVSTYESPDPDPKLTSTNWIWANTDEIKRWDRTAYFVDKTLDFLSRHPEQPCFINLWPDDVHTPWVYEDDGGKGRESEVNFTEVLAELDVQIGRLMQGLKDLGIDENTMVVFTSDNGPAPAFSGKRTDDLRGRKATLYEGGIRMPFIVRWPGTVPAGRVNDSSVLCSVDLFPSFCAITGTELPTKYSIDGEDMSQVLLGASEAGERTNPLFWEFGIHLANRVSPHLAVRDGDWKLLVNADGSNVELYNMKTDFLEKTNVAFSNPEVVNRLKPMLIDWFENSFREFADNIVRVAADGDASADGSSWDNATTIEHAITLSQQNAGTKIWMKAGIYSVSTTSLNFDNLVIYGGFAGTETKLAERDWHVNQTIFDGNNSVSPLRNDNLSAVSTSVLDGVIVQNGLNQSGANGNGNGGAMILANGATIRNCIFRNNRTQNAKNGAAIHCHSGNIRIENSLFVNNTSSGNGGAVQVGGGTTATIINCTFANNQSTKPGGAFGLGNNTSNLTLINTVAYNNLYGTSTFNSYGQNDNIDGGGTVLSKNSAIESTSNKFKDGDDIFHITLTRDTTPQFVSPATLIGYAQNAAEWETVEAASYQLAEGSLCIDAGNANLIGNIEFDLAGSKRISGNQIDIGAYEFDSGTFNTNQLHKNSWVIHTTAHSIDIAGINKDEQIALYDISGKLLYQKQADSNSMSISLSEKGFYLLKIENEAFKLLFR